MFRNVNKREIKNENIMTTMENSGPNFKVTNQTVKYSKEIVLIQGQMNGIVKRQITEYSNFKRVQKVWLINIYKD